MAKKKLTFTISLDEDVAVAVIAEAMKQASGAPLTAPVSTEEPLLPVAAPEPQSANAIKGLESGLSAEPLPEVKKLAEKIAEDAAASLLDSNTAEPNDPQSTLIAMLGGEEPTPATEYTHKSLGEAAREWVLAGADLDEQKARTNKISGAIMKVGAKAVSEIAPEKLGAFAETLKGLGVDI